MVEFNNLAREFISIIDSEDDDSRSLINEHQSKNFDYLNDELNSLAREFISIIDSEDDDRRLLINEHQSKNFNYLNGELNKSTKLVLKFDLNFREKLIQLLNEYSKSLISNRDISIDKKEFKKSKIDLIKLLTKTPSKLNRESNSKQFIINLDNDIKYQIIDLLIKNENIIIDSKDKIDLNLRNQLIEENKQLISKLNNQPIEYINNLVHNDNQSNDDESDNELDEENKLRSYDTTNHLKNKRINAMTNKADADKVNNILNTLDNQMNYDDQESSSNVKNFNNNVNNIVDSDYVSQSINYQTGPFELKQLHFLLKRSPKLRLGLTISGGRGTTPYKYQDKSIFVSNVVEGSPAHLAGFLKEDKILKVNEISLENASHYFAVETFKNAGDNFTVVVSREVPINFTQTNSSTSLHSTTVLN